MVEEIVIHENGDIKITNLRAVFGSKTYSVANITSVEKKEISASSCLPLIIMATGVLFIISGLTTRGVDSNLVTIGIGVFVLIVGFMIATKSKPSYSVSLTTAGGEVKAFQSLDEPTIKSIVEALNTAIVNKG